MKRIILLATLSSLLLGCAGQMDEQNTSNNSDDTTISSEQNNQNEEKEIESYRNIVQNFTTISATEITDKINKGDAFYLFIGKETCPYCREFAPKLEETTEIFENGSSDPETGVEGKIYYLDLINEDPETAAKFASEYKINSVPAFHYFEGQIYHSEIEDIDSENITVDEIKEFINTPYYDEHITTAPDISIDN